MDVGEAITRLRAARVGRLATVTPEGSPHVVPLVFAVLERDGGLVAYWVVDEKPKRSRRLQRLRNIE
ncbi:MAG: pyridoxamine 5'-phosphate oxidase family protein, partial [Actinomycetota bacterium]